MSRRKILVIASVLVLVLAGLYGTYRLANSRTMMVTGDLVARVHTDQRVIALTFDDGPSDAVVTEIREALRAESVVGTFFLVGDQIAEHPAAAKELAADGHQLANHSYTHQRMWFHTPGGGTPMKSTGPTRRYAPSTIKDRCVSARRTERSSSACRWRSTIAA